MDTPRLAPYHGAEMKLPNRREALKTLFLGAACSNVIGESWAAPMLFDLRPLAQVQTGLLRVLLADFPTLSQDLGSVRISTSPLEAGGDRQTGLFPPVIINRAEGGGYHVLSAACTHEDCTVRRLDKNSRTMNCPCHGSRYNIDGTVERTPANQPLRALAFRATPDGYLDIEMPDVFYEMHAVRTPAQNRVEISFLGFDRLTYQIYFRETLGGPAAQVNFSRTAAGPLDQTEITVADNYVSAFVERPGRAGFFHVALKTQEV